MKAVVIGESSGASMETIMGVYPRHKTIVDKYVAQGEVIGIGHLPTGATWQFSEHARQQKNL